MMQMRALSKHIGGIKTCEKLDLTKGTGKNVYEKALNFKTISARKRADEKMETETMTAALRHFYYVALVRRSCGGTCGVG